jgi:hypothetical protein
MTMQVPLAAAEAHVGPDGPVDVHVGAQTIVVDHGDGGPTPLELLTSALASCSALSARTHLARDGDRGEITVVVTLDAGPPPCCTGGSCCRCASTRRRAPARRGLERTEVTMMLRPAFSIRTQVEHAGEPLM